MQSAAHPWFASPSSSIVHSPVGTSEPLHQRTNLSDNTNQISLAFPSLNSPLVAYLHTSFQTLAGFLDFSWCIYEPLRPPGFSISLGLRTPVFYPPPVGFLDLLFPPCGTRVLCSLSIAVDINVMLIPHCNTALASLSHFGVITH